MPTGTTPRELTRAIETRSTSTTRALKKLFTNAKKHRATADFNRLRQNNALNAVLDANNQRQLPNWARNRLSAESPNLSALELRHIGEWPDGQKNDIRKALVDAIVNDRAVKFFWELHDVTSEDELTLIENPDSTGGITITFRSPRRNVQGGDITVTVGP
jgi:hypothetical protein